MIYLVLFFIFFFCTLIYLLLMIFAPEWVGISKINPHDDPQSKEPGSATNSSQPDGDG